ncbi:rod shape-determining protein MreC [Pseudodesulfovibrio sp. zrk46]|uniref:rod shape-determining protein MreC n=1 Tax=Pseudodesulfovibrio sp. zrk46 TaxID=2725288 RepID=UPI001448F901|nr:rod shape-determining protein MreC [Pseudodesulfovibrio sp. zrk46]QJB56269.1 rod shape-determining protein MreC [Pseudodesulfovibrio sp. zrk46]
MKKPNKIVVVIVAGLFVYLSMFTWNLRTGHLDALSSYTGLDISGYLLRPGLWVKDQVVGFWERYIYLVGLKQENDTLLAEVARLKQENMFLNERADHGARLDKLLGFVPPEEWDASGARVIAHRMGPAGVLDTISVDRGAATGVEADMPVLSLDGVVGRVLKAGAMNSSILLLTDANSRIAVVGGSHRSPGMLSGQGYGQALKLRFVNLNAVIDSGELLLTSGLSGIFPKGLPVARVTKVQRSDISLFLTVEAEPLIDVGSLEEVLLLQSQPRQLEAAPEVVPEGEAANAEAENGAATQ